MKVLQPETGLSRTPVSPSGYLLCRTGCGLLLDATQPGSPRRPKFGRQDQIPRGSTFIWTISIIGECGLRGLKSVRLPGGWKTGYSTEEEGTTIDGKQACIVVALRVSFALTIAVTAGACLGAGSTRSAAPGQTFIATHRGDPALPENTVAAFRSALDAGAEYLETDLVASKDGVLVLRHDRRLSPTTDVEDHLEFADRRATKTLYGRAVSDWWLEDFTAAELATLRATMRDAAPDGDYRIATLDELIAFARDETARRGRAVGLYLETKQPALYKRLGHDLEDLLAKILRANGLDRAGTGVYVQSWNPGSVRELSALGVAAVQLISAARHWNEGVSARGLRSLREQGGEGINVVDERLERDPGLIGRAHAAGLEVHGWGFERGEDYRRWIRAGLDGLVTDDVRAALAAREL